MNTLSRPVRAAFGLAVLLVACPSTLDAESLVLKNGARVRGKVSAARSTETLLALELEGGGFALLPRSLVAAVEPDGAPAGPARAAEAKPAPAVQKHAAQADAGPRAIPTTHRVRLKNGAWIPGNALPGALTAPLVLEVPGMGRMVLARERIAEIEAVPGAIRLPEAVPEPPAPAQREAPAGGPAAGGPAGGPIAAPGPEAAPLEKVEGAAPPPGPEIASELAVDEELHAEIEQLLYELTRWRTRNRVRAENHLRRIGPPAIPFLAQVVRDPFDLTRRAAMRIVRDVGHPVGIPLAIEGLLDEDSFVRETAAEALKDITKLDLGYRADASFGERLDAHRRWLQWWEANTERR